MRKRCKKGQIFKDVVGWPQYQISNYGRVWSKKNKRFLRPIVLNSGYIQIQLHTVGAKKRVYIHQLIVDAFIRVYDRATEQCDHINHVRGDNRLQNLHILTIKEHHKDQITRQRISNALKEVKREKDPVTGKFIKKGTVE